MDERQTKIVEGAGLEESRINEDLIAFLNKWSFPVLLVVAIISGAYYVKNMYDERKIATRDEAFAQLGAVEASQTPSVISLTGIANEYEGVGSVAELARLKAADVHMRAARTGVDPADGITELSDDDRSFHLEKAEGLFRAVLESSADDPERTLIAVNAAFGLAAVAETRGDADAARAHYERAESLSNAAGYAPLAAVAAELLAEVDSAEAPVLYSKAELPRMPYEPEPQPETSAEALPELPDQPAVAGPEPVFDPPADADTGEDPPAAPETVPEADPDDG